MPDSESIFSKPSLLRTLVTVMVAAACLSVIDGVLAGVSQTETGSEAARRFHEGGQLAQRGDFTAAADRYKDAIADARENTEYRLALGEVLISAGRFSEAEAALRDLLAANSLAGAANLAMARVLAKTGRIPEATSYYHRAIYGQWKDDVRGNQYRVRFELAELLAQGNSREDLLAELLPLQGQAPADDATQKRLGRLYLAAGSPARAAVIFHAVLQLRSEDAAAREGLGEAQFAQGNYEAARNSFSAALEPGAESPDTRERLDLSAKILDMDPSRRGLSEAEQYERSMRLLALVTGRTSGCTSPAESSEAAQMPLKHPMGSAARREEADRAVELAGQLWNRAKETCHITDSPTDQALELVLRKVAVQPGER